MKPEDPGLLGWDGRPLKQPPFEEREDIILHNMEDYPVLTKHLKAGYLVRPLLKGIPTAMGWCPKMGWSI